MAHILSALSRKPCATWRNDALMMASLTERNLENARKGFSSATRTGATR